MCKQEMANSREDVMAEKPTRPEEWECCESSCTPCVWDTYYEEMREWKAAQKAAAQKTVSDSDNSENKV